MSNEILYKPKKKKVFGNEKWVASLVLKNTWSFEAIVNDVVGNTSGQRGEVSGVLRAYLGRIRAHVLEGEAVKIDGLGTFYPRVSVKFVEKTEDVSVKNCIKNITIGFRPEQKLLKMVKEAGIRKCTTKENEWEE